MRLVRPLSVLPLVALVLTAGCHKQEAPAPQPAQAAEATPASEPALTAVKRDNAGKSAPDVAFTDLVTGKETKIADFKGKPVLVNLWATWCVPCVKELPTLDRLAKAQGDKLAVLAISQDMQGEKVVQPFLQSKGVTLHPYHDRDNALMLATKEAGLPVSILYGADGKELWRKQGDLDWTGARARSLLAEAGLS